jgi:glycosyltransferase involved in cell wall biosynthesis
VSGLDHAVTLVAYEVYSEAGLERSLVETIRRAEGIRWTVVSRTLIPELRERVEWRRAPAPDRPFKAKATAFAASATLRLLNRRGLLHVVGPLLPLRADLVTVQFLRSGFYEAIGAPLRGLTALHVELERRFLAGARALAAPSPAGVRDLERRFPGKRVYYVPNGVDIERFRPDAEARHAMRADLGVEPTRLVALFVGNGWWRKGLAETIQALRGVPEMELWVAGLGVPEHYQRLVEQQAPGRVRFLGVRRDLEHVYPAADVFVLPSRYETFLIAAYEAAASGLPVVVTRVAGLDELVGDDEAGVLVELRPDAIAAALGDLAASAERRAAMAAEAQLRAKQFTWDRSVSALLEVYRDLSAGR